MDHVLFIHSSVDGHVGGFHILAVVNSGCYEHRGMCVFLNCSFLWDICSRVELLDHMATLFLVFQGTSILFSIKAAPAYVLSNSVGGFPFPYTSNCYLQTFSWGPFWVVWDGKITLTLSALINCPDALILQLLVQNFKLGIFFLGLNLSVMVVFLALRTFFVNSQKNCESSVNLMGPLERSWALENLGPQGWWEGQTCIDSSVFHGRGVGRPRCVRCTGPREQGGCLGRKFCLTMATRQALVLYPWNVRFAKSWKTPEEDREEGKNVFPEPVWYEGEKVMLTSRPIVWKKLMVPILHCNWLVLSCHLGI